MATMSENQRTYLTNMMNGKTETGAAARPGQQTWAKAQLAKAPSAPAAPALSTQTTQRPAVSPQVQAYSSAMMGNNAAGAAGNVVQFPVTRANQTLGQLQEASNKQFEYNAESDPAYQAAMATARQNITQQQADTNARLRAGGQGKSSYSEGVANQIGAQEMSRVSTEVLPQLISQAYAREQDKLSNLRNLYALQNQEDFQNRVTEAGMTGNYMPEQARLIANQLNNLKLVTEQNWSQMTAEQRAAARSQGDQLRAQLQGMGIDPSLFGADVTANAAMGNVNRAGLRTMDGQQLDYNISTDQRNYDRNVLESDRAFGRNVLESDRAYQFQTAQQEWENQFRQGQFDEQKAARIWEQAFQEKSFAQSVQDAAASRGLQWASLSQREKERVADLAFREEQFKYQQKKDELDRAASSNKYDYRADPSFSEDIAFINSNPAAGINEVRTNSQALIQQYGYTGYQELLKAAEAAAPKDDPLAALLNR